MAEDLYFVSDGLLALRRKLADFEHSPTVLSPEDARALADQLKALAAVALKREFEISKFRWNAIRTDREMETDIVVEATRPGTNLRLFAPSGRPFSDGRPPSTGGGA